MVQLDRVIFSVWSHSIDRQCLPGSLSNFLITALASPPPSHNSGLKSWYSPPSISFRTSFMNESTDSIQIMAGWRNGSASDSRSEGCVFESRSGQGLLFFFDLRLQCGVLHWRSLYIHSGSG